MPVEDWPNRQAWISIQGQLSKSVRAGNGSRQGGEPGRHGLQRENLKRVEGSPGSLLHQVRGCC